MAYDDYEESERVQAWLRHNGIPIAIAIIVGLALVFGYRQWNKHRAAEQVAAADQYQLVQQAVAAGKPTIANSLTDSLLKNHAHSTYAVLAATLRARTALAAGDNKRAVTALQWAAGHAQDKTLKALTQLRLARAQLYAGDANAALTALDAIPGNAYLGMAQELRGDVEVKLGHDQQALQAYRSALTAYKTSAPQRRIVQMKITNLALPASAASAVATVAATSHSKPARTTDVPAAPKSAGDTP